MLDTPAIRQAVDAIRAVYAEPSGIVGGKLHIVIDDWNLETGHLDYCQPETDAERRCHEALSALTLEERASALAIHDGFLG